MRSLIQHPTIRRIKNEQKKIQINDSRVYFCEEFSNKLDEPVSNKRGRKWLF
jgi:hypothetical protein